MSNFCSACGVMIRPPRIDAVGNEIFEPREPEELCALCEELVK